MCHEARPPAGSVVRNMASIMHAMHMIAVLAANCAVSCMARVSL